MKRSTKFALAAVAALGVAAVAVPVVAQQGQMQHDGMMDGGMGMMGHWRYDGWRYGNDGRRPELCHGHIRYQQGRHAQPRGNRQLIQAELRDLRHRRQRDFVAGGIRHDAATPDR